MGDVEDTFTKQEIQAGYVTSGRDVLARQQQIVAQALSAASGAAGAAPRRRVGGGGPSGTGKAASSPVFPPPSYDEPAKPSLTLVPPPSVNQRAVTTGSGFPTIAAANATHAAANVPPLTRSNSAGAPGPNSALSGPTPKGSIGSVAAQTTRKNVIGTPGLASSNAMAPAGATAASVVAGVHSVSGSSEPPAPHTTLTPLTPLKRSVGNKGGAKTTVPDASTTKLTSLRATGGKKQNGTRTGGSAPGSPGSEASGGNNNMLPGRIDGFSSIGGAVIAAPVAVAPPIIGGSVGSLNGVTVGGTARPSPLSQLGGDGLGGLGGEIFTGSLKPSGIKSAVGSGAPIGSGKDKWNSNAFGGDPVVSVNPGGLWGNGGAAVGPSGFGHPNMSQVGGAVIGGGGFHNNGSSALASMLGINLPTGSGSLREQPDLWSNAAPPGQAPISALNGSSMPLQGVIGSGSSNPSNGLIGGVTIGGGHAPMGAGTIGGGGNKNDIALLQSLLPGVHITSGGGGMDNWNSAPGPNQLQQQQALGGNLRMGDPHQAQQWQGGLQSSLGGQPIGAIGQNASKQPQRPAPGSIW